MDAFQSVSPLAERCIRSGQQLFTKKPSDSATKGQKGRHLSSKRYFFDSCGVNEGRISRPPDTQVGGQQSATLWRHTLNSTYPQGGSAWNATPPTNFDQSNDNLVLARPIVTEILFSPGRQDGLDGSRAANSLDPNLIKLRGS